MGDKEKTTRFRPLGRLVAILLGVVVVLEVLYLAGGNGFLRTDWGRDTLNRRPEKLTITWESAWTWLPGIVHVRDLEIGGKARRAEWRTSVESGRMVIFLPSLLRRHLLVSLGRVQGAEIEVGLLEPPETPRPASRRRPWRVSLNGLVVEPLHTFRLNEYELRGQGRATGWAHFEVRGPVEFDISSLAFEETVVLEGDEVTADALLLDGRLRMAPFVVGEDTLEDLLAGLTGSIALDTEASGLGFLASYLEQVPWLRLGGSGHLTADLEVTNGWMAPGSILTLDGPMIGADLFGLQATGEGRLEGRVPEDGAHTELSVRLPQFSVSRQLDGARLLVGNDLEVVVTNDSTAIDRPAQGISMALTLPPTRIPNLAAFSFYLPEATGLEVTGGTGELAANFNYSTTEGSGSGRLRLDGRQVEAAFRDVDLRADVLLDSRLSDARLEDGQLDLSGTRLVIDKVRTREKGRLRDSDWWGRIRIPAGKLVKPLGDPAAPPALIEARIAAELRDTGPLVALLEQHLPRLSWIDGLLTVHDVKASSNVRIQGPRIALGDLEVTGGKKSRLELLGELDLGRKDASGVFFARWGKVSAAVSLAEGDRDWKLTRSRRWYERNLASYKSSGR